MSRQLRLVVYGGLFTALTLLATLFLKIPTGIGYANMGDGFVLAAGALLGPFAGIPAALGSMLADLMLGYTIYAPATLVIKGLMGLLAGLFIQKAAAFSWKNLLLFAALELWMVLGYFLFECVLYGVAAALGSVVPNLLQGVVGAVLALILVPLLQKLEVHR